MSAMDQSASMEMKCGNSMADLKRYADTAGVVGFSTLGKVMKRSADVAIALFLCVILSPLFVFTAAAIALTSRGPLVFGHERVGLGGRSFRCWKFRTMCEDADRVLAGHLATNPAARREWQETRKLKRDPRVTALGRVLRQYSVDELPQLLNVLAGDMSLVGPRPIVDEELRHYGPQAQHYLAVRPGITGLWQVSGRSDTDYVERVDLDVKYVETLCFWTDVSILVRTIPAVMGARGSY